MTELSERRRLALYGACPACDRALDVRNVSDDERIAVWQLFCPSGCSAESQNAATVTALFQRPAPRTKRTDGAGLRNPMAAIVAGSDG